MLRFLKPIFASSIIFLGASFLANAQDVEAGKKVFNKCRACHAVGEGAKSKIGPHLNDLFGRPAGTLEKFKFSKAMKEAGSQGMLWGDDTLSQFITKPRKFIKKTKMSFSGLKNEKQRADLISYLKQFSEAQAVPNAVDEPASKEQKTPKEQSSSNVIQGKKAVALTSVVLARDVEIPKHGMLHLGRVALTEEVSAWDIDIRPDGKGLPAGKGSVAQGELIYVENCAVCHGDFGEGVDRWPVLAGGQGTLQEDRPEKTIGSYWPYLSTVYDYVRRAMPFGNARSLSDDDVYALTAYLMFLNDIVEDEDFELSKENFLDIRLPNEANFIDDNRRQEPHYVEKLEPCMKDCKTGIASVILRARILDVTPDNEGKKEGE